MPKLIKGRKGGKGESSGSSGIPQEQPDTLKAVQTAYVVELLGEGEIHGLVNGLQSVYLDGTPLQNADGTFNYNGFDLHLRTGSAEQAPIEGHTSVESEVFLDGNTEVTFGSPITRRILKTESSPDAVRVKINIPALSYLDDTGVLGPTSVEIKISVSYDDGPYQPIIIADTISGKATSPYSKAYRIPLNTAAQLHWDVRVERLTADSEEVRLQNKTFWSAYTELYDFKIQYADSAVVGWKIDAEQFGSDIPGREYEVNGIMIKVPTNYDTATRTYDDEVTPWGGTFKLLSPDDVVCSNPIWILFDLITNRRYGLGRYNNERGIDIFAFYEAAKWCDEQVPNGVRLPNGEMDTEPRYSFNGVIAQAEDAFTVLGSIASNCHARLYWGPGVVSIAIDKPKDPVGLVSPANVVDGAFSYASDSLRDRHSVINVTWNNPLDGYRPDIERVDDPGMIASFGVRELDVVAPGVTSRSEARRFGKYLLETEKLENQIVTYKTGLDQAGRAPGDIVEIADPTIAGVEYGGRLVAASGDPITFTLDQEITFDADETYTISYVTPEGTVISTELVNPGNVTTSEVTSVVPLFTLDIPNSGAMWTISSTAVETRLFSILSVADLGQSIYEFTAVLHNPDKFAAIEDDYEIPGDNTTIFPTGPIQKVRDVSATLVVSRTGGAAVVTIDVGWTPPNDPRVVFYDVFVKRPGTATFSKMDFTQSVTSTLGQITAGWYTFRVVCIDALGRRSAPFDKTFDFTQLGAIPGDVQNFFATVVGGLIQLTWDPLSLISLDHYEIRYDGATSGAIWGASIPLVTGVAPSTTSLFVPKLNGSYLIKAFDIFGQESLNAAVDVVTNIDDAQYNEIGSIQEDPDFNGDKDRCFVNGSALWMVIGDVMADWDPLSDADPIAGDVGPTSSHQSTYTFDNAFDLGAIYDVRLTGHVMAHVENYFSNYMAGWVTLAQLETMAGIAVNPTTVELYVRTTQDDPGGTPTWSMWKRFSVGTFRGRGFQFKLILKTSNGMYTPAVTQLRVAADMQDRTISGTGTSSNSATTSVAFSPEFYSGATVDVSATLTNGQQGDYYTISNGDSAGFDIDVYNSVGGRVIRNFSFIARAWGAKI